MLKPIFIDAATNSKDSKPISVNVEVGKGTEKSVKPDWNQNNPNANDYIKNRPFYTYFDTEQQEYVVVPIESKYLSNAAPDYTLKEISTDLSDADNLYLLIHNILSNDYSRYSLSTIISFIENSSQLIADMRERIEDLEIRVTALEEGHSSSMSIDSEGYLIPTGVYMDEDSWLVLDSNYYVDEENLLNCG